MGIPLWIWVQMSLTWMALTTQESQAPLLTKMENHKKRRCFRWHLSGQQWWHLFRMSVLILDIFSPRHIPVKREKSVHYPQVLLSKDINQRDFVESYRISPWRIEQTKVDLKTFGERCYHAVNEFWNLNSGPTKVQRNLQKHYSQTFGVSRIGMCLLHVRLLTGDNSCIRTFFPTLAGHKGKGQAQDRPERLCRLQPLFGVADMINKGVIHLQVYLL